MRRGTLLVLLLLLAAVAIPLPLALTKTSQPAAAQQAADVRADFNQDGFADLAIGAPGEAIGSFSDAGAVSVLYGSADGLRGTGSQLFTQVGGAAERGDRFGWALASGDFNHDGFTDLAAGAPGENVSAFRRWRGQRALRHGQWPHRHRRAAVHPGRRPLRAQRQLRRGSGIRRLQPRRLRRPGRQRAWRERGQPASLAQSASSMARPGGSPATGGRLFTQVGGAVEPVDGSASRWHRATSTMTASPTWRPARLGTVGTLDGAGAVSILYGSAGWAHHHRWAVVHPGRRCRRGRRPLRRGLGGRGLQPRRFRRPSRRRPRSRTWAASAPLARSACCTARPVGSPPAVGGCSPRSAAPVEAGDWFGEALGSGDFNHDGFADLAAGAPGEDRRQRSGSPARSACCMARPAG